MDALAKRKQLVERLRDDQRRCWQAGRPQKVEQYLAAHPTLATDEESLLDFVYSEVCLREEFGETLEAAEYEERFPHLATSLARLFEVHSLLGVNAAEVAETIRQPEASQADATKIVSAMGTSTSRASPSPRTADGLTHEIVPATLVPGEKVGRYRIERLLGHGSFGSVYRAADEQLRRSVAIKILRPDRLAGDAEIRFLEELRTVARLKHPLIVPVYDVGRHSDGRAYAVMELVEGQSLRDSLAGGGLPSPARAAELIATIAEVIEYAHRQGFVHCDLKPANILVDPAGRPHVLDFGMAIHGSCQRDRLGEMAGTVAYMAPEQGRRELHQLDGRADIWALGMMLYAMLTGRRPFDGRDLKDLCDEILHRQPKPLRQINDAIPQEVERICLKCLRLNVSQRYLTAGDLARDLRRWKRPRATRPILLAMAAAAVLLAATAIWFSTRADKTSREAKPAGVLPGGSSPAK